MNEVADFAALAAFRHHRRVVILDVRHELEWAASRIDGALHIPLHHLPSELSGGEQQRVAIARALKNGRLAVTPAATRPRPVP